MTLAERTKLEPFQTLVSLASLELGRRAIIRVIGRSLEGVEDGLIERRLLEIGFEEGRETEIRHLGPIGGDPIAVRVDRMSVAMRRSEAAFVLVEPQPALPGPATPEPERRP